MKDKIINSLFIFSLIITLTIFLSQVYTYHNFRLSGLQKETEYRIYNIFHLIKHSHIEYSRTKEWSTNIFLPVTNKLWDDVSLTKTENSLEISFTIPNELMKEPLFIKALNRFLLEEAIGKENYIFLYDDKISVVTTSYSNNEINWLEGELQALKWNIFPMNIGFLFFTIFMASFSTIIFSLKLNVREFFFPDIIFNQEKT